MRNKFSFISLFISIASIVSTTILNYHLAQSYLTAGGKTKALFGIIEISRLNYKLWFFIGGLIAFIAAIIAVKRKENKKLYRVSFILSLVAMILVFIRFWKWMI